MAKVVIEFDTNGKTMSATVDGVAVDNVVGAEVRRKDYYGYGGPEEDDGEDPEFCFCLTQVEHDKANKMSKMTRVVASHHPEASLSDARPVDGIPSARRLPASVSAHGDAVRSIVDYFRRD